MHPDGWVILAIALAFGSCHLAMWASGKLMRKWDDIENQPDWKTLAALGSSLFALLWCFVVFVWVFGILVRSVS